MVPPRCKPGPPRDENRRRELLDAAVDYVLENGLADLSVRPFAAALGISPRTLLYHFESKEKLVVEVLEQALIQERLRYGAHSEAPDALPVQDFLRTNWARYQTPRTRLYLRLFFEVCSLELRNPRRYGNAARSMLRDLVEVLERMLIRDGVPAERASAAATLLQGAGWGLLLDQIATRDRKRIDLAWEELMCWLETIVCARNGTLEPVAANASPSIGPA